MFSSSISNAVPGHVERRFLGCARSCVCCTRHVFIPFNRPAPAPRIPVPIDSPSQLHPKRPNGRRSRSLRHYRRRVPARLNGSGESSFPRPGGPQHAHPIQDSATSHRIRDRHLSRRRARQRLRRQQQQERESERQQWQQRIPEQRRRGRLHHHRQPARPDRCRCSARGSVDQRRRGRPRLHA